jgi:hypothetical protein
VDIEQNDQIEDLFQKTKFHFSDMLVLNSLGAKLANISSKDCSTISMHHIDSIKRKDATFVLLLRSHPQSHISQGSSKISKPRHKCRITGHASIVHEKYFVS